MNEKIIASVFLIVISVLAIFCSGCCTQRGTITDDAIVASEVSLARLQAANDALRETNLLIADEVGDIRETAGNISDGISRAIYYFDEYEKLVQVIIERLRRIEQETRIREGEGILPEPYIGLGGNPFLD